MAVLIRHLGFWSLNGARVVSRIGGAADRAVSWAQSPLARIGLPIVRTLQARFRRDSAAAMRRAVSAGR